LVRLVHAHRDHLALGHALRAPRAEQDRDRVQRIVRGHDLHGARPRARQPPACRAALCARARVPCWRRAAVRRPTSRSPSSVAGLSKGCRRARDQSARVAACRAGAAVAGARAWPGMHPGVLAAPEVRPPGVGRDVDHRQRFDAARQRDLSNGGRRGSGRHGPNGGWRLGQLRRLRAPSKTAARAGPGVDRTGFPSTSSVTPCETSHISETMD